MKNALILFLLVVPFVAQSNDILYNRLEKLHSKDQIKCLEVAKRYIHHFPDNSAAYYFSSVIYNDKADNAKNAIGRYRNLKQAINYAVKFEKKDDGTVSEKVNWSEYTTELSKRARAVATELDALNEDQYSDNLLANLDKLDQTISINYGDLVLESEETDKIETIRISPEEETEIIDLNASTEVVEVNSASNMQFFGLPKGNEMVTSANLRGEREVLALINKERVRKGMAELEWDEDLANAARYHAYDLATQDYFDHQSFDRKGGKLVQVGGTFERIKKFYSKSFVNSENIAAGNKSSQATYDQWYNSKGHYDNMFNSSSKKVGLGVYYDPNSTYGYYWVFCTAL